jgi:hypothetical protein
VPLLAASFFAASILSAAARNKSAGDDSAMVLGGSFIAFCALFDASAIAKARGLRGLLQAP